MDDLMMHRQGDILFVAVDAVPKDAKPSKRIRRRYVIAEGEATGHAHTVDADACEMYEGTDGNLYIRVRHQVQVRHEEHAPIDLNARVWKAIRQREYSPEEIRKVSD